MRELDKTKVYSLEDLTSDEYRTLYNWLLGNDSGWRYVHFESWKNNNIGFNLVHNGSNWSMQEVKPTHNAKELFYTLENIQVDCSELSDEQIKEMADVFEKSGFDMGSLYKTDNYFHLNDDNNNYCVVGSYFDNKTTITCDKFMELFSRKEEETEWIIENNNKQAYKETANKLNYELDFNFITQLAERMAQNKHKYEPYNWQKLDNIAELKQALFRHVLEVMKGNYEDDNRLFGHLESIALNCMFINYQLNKQSEK